MESLSIRTGRHPYLRFSAGLHRVLHFAHKNLVWLLLISYALAALAPDLGLAIRAVVFAKLTWVDGSHVSLSLSALMIALLLFNAGLSVRASELKNLATQPFVLGAGIAANILVPLVFTLGAQHVLALWPYPEQTEVLLAGLAIIISMPIAGSSTAWSHQCSGNLVVSLGLVFLSTILSPLTAPITIKLIAALVPGDYARDLQLLASQGLGAFLIYLVVVPSFLGIGANALIGEERISKAKTEIKLLNLALIIILNYSNAATILPQVLGAPDWRFICLLFAVALTLCSLCFFVGWRLPGTLRAGRENQVSIMYGIGMNNNGTALVMAASGMAGHPLVMLPIIIYTLVQHIVAAIATSLVSHE